MSSLLLTEFTGLKTEKMAAFALIRLRNAAVILLFFFLKIFNPLKALKIKDIYSPNRSSNPTKNAKNDEYLTEKYIKNTLKGCVSWKGYFCSATKRRTADNFTVTFYLSLRTVLARTSAYTDSTQSLLCTTKKRTLKGVRIVERILLLHNKASHRRQLYGYFLP